MQGPLVRTAVEWSRILVQIGISRPYLATPDTVQQCNVQDIGETKRHLSDRSGENTHAIEKAITQQHINQPTAISEHLTLPAHSMDNIELVPLELIVSNGYAIRKARKAFLVFKGSTLEPFGLNDDEIWSIIFVFFMYPF